MLSNNDLYDLSAAFIILRNNIFDEMNGNIIEKLTAVLTNYRQTYDDNQIRKAISSIENIDGVRWYYIYHLNVYPSCKILKNKGIYELLIRMCLEMRQLLTKKKYCQAQELIDAIHCLPEIIAENNFRIPQSYWKIHIKPYRKKWDKNFVKKEEKALRKTGGGSLS